ncbi:MAG: hypothetical protein ACRYHA_34830 [Janthinobacterium lividum]
MIESVCRYIAILALLVRIGLSFYMNRTLGREASGPDPAAETPARTLRSAWMLFANIWVVIALAIWLTALLHAQLSADGL